MSSVGSILGGGAAKGAVSGVSLVLVDKWMDSQYRMSTNAELMRGVSQALLSLWGSTIEGLLRSVLPAGAAPTTMWLRPIGVGLSFMVVVSVLLKDGTKMVYNFLASTGSELVANYVVGNPVTGALLPTPMPGSVLY